MSEASREVVEAPRPALSYDHGADHRPPIDAFSVAVIAVRFIAIGLVTGSTWAVSSVAQSLVSGADWREGFILGAVLSLAVNIVLAVMLWLAAEPLAKWILPRAARVGVTGGGAYAAVGIALIGFFVAATGMPYLFAVAGEYLREWFPPPPATGGLSTFSSSFMLDGSGRLVTLAVSLAQVAMGLLILFSARWLARLRPFRA